jgi:hypothetical protein
MLIRWLSQGASPNTLGYIGETAFHNLGPFKNTVEAKPNNRAKTMPLDVLILPD